MARFVINAQKTGLVQLRERDSFQTGSVNITNVLILDKEVTVRCPTNIPGSCPIKSALKTNTLQLFKNRQIRAVFSKV